jgi:hypothetical protein
MAYLHNNVTVKHQSMGQKVLGYMQNGVEKAGAMKGIWDAGRSIYGIARAVGPALAIAAV